ncbi:MAG: UDP-2,3-diacylglucosamine diphosphatase [Planctomycetes bacterium]|nr:UDP-2,3-diacylglucosamine diphosphatase [Planctomycetota bacterium]
MIQYRSDDERRQASLAEVLLGNHGLGRRGAGATKRRYRAVFLSDVHLGARAAKVEFLSDFLAELETEHLYLVGDIIDEWKLRRSFHWPSSHGRVLRRFAELADAGVDVVYLTGNHDASLRMPGALPDSRVRCVDEVVHETADGRRLLVLHGDAFDAHADGQAWHVRLGERAYELALGLNHAYNGVARLFGADYRSVSLYLKQLVKQAVRAIDRFERGAVAACRERGLDGVVCGHIHKAELRELEGYLYANTGDWVESCTALVEHLDGRLELLQWRAGRAVPIDPARRVAAVDPRAARGVGLREATA